MTVCAQVSFVIALLLILFLLLRIKNMLSRVLSLCICLTMPFFMLIMV